MEEISARLALMSGMGSENLHDSGATGPPSEKARFTSRRGKGDCFDTASFRAYFDANFGLVNQVSVKEFYYNSFIFVRAVTFGGEAI